MNIVLQMPHQQPVEERRKIVMKTTPRSPREDPQVGVASGRGQQRGQSVNFLIEYEEDESEESGKDWDELEAEARKGGEHFRKIFFIFRHVCPCVYS